MLVESAGVSRLGGSFLSLHSVHRCPLPDSQMTASSSSPSGSPLELISRHGSGQCHGINMSVAHGRHGAAIAEAANTSLPVDTVVCSLVGHTQLMRCYRFYIVDSIQ